MNDLLQHGQRGGDEFIDRLDSDAVFTQGLLVPLVDAVQALLAGYGKGSINVPEILNVVAIEGSADGMFSSDTTNLHFLNRFGELVVTKACDLTGKAGKDGQIYRTWGDVIRESELKKMLSGDAQSVADLVAKVRTVVLNNIVQYQKTYRQCTRQEIRVDMFADRSELKIRDGKAIQVKKFNPLPVVDEITKEQEYEVVSDFVEHFPELRDFVNYICAARFARDRRKAFLWLHCSPGWGKTFLMTCMKELGLVAEISVKEIESAGEGKPVGLNADTISCSWVLAVDEAKYVKSELKQLNNEMTFSPKFQQQVTVPLYMKLFISAEGIDSLAGSEGVEKQFAERFSYMTGQGVLERREVFQQMGGGMYHDCMKQVIAQHINDYVKRMRGLGQRRAERESSMLLTELHAKYRIDMTLGRLEDSVEDYAEELRKLLVAYGSWKPQIMCGDMNMPDCVAAMTKDLQGKLKASVVVGYSGKSGMREKVVCLKRPISFVKAWVQWRVDRSEAGKLVHKARDIAARVSIEDIDKPTSIYRSNTDAHREQVKVLVCPLRSEAELSFI